MSSQLTKETLVEWLEKCDYLKCASSAKNELIEFGYERLYGALRKLPLNGRIAELAPPSNRELGFALLQHHFEVDEVDGAGAEESKSYKKNIRDKAVNHANGYLSLMMKTVARELAKSEWEYDGCHNADGSKSADADRPSVVVNQGIIDRCTNGGIEDEQPDAMPSLSGAVGTATDWDPDADVYGVEPSTRGGASLGGPVVLEACSKSEFTKKVDLAAVEKIDKICKLKNCGACYYIMTSLDGDYSGIIGKTAYYDTAKAIKDIIRAGDRSLDLRRAVGLRIQSYFENDWRNDPVNAKMMAAIEKKQDERRKLAQLAAYGK